jgi:spermidine synthase
MESQVSFPRRSDSRPTAFPAMLLMSRRYLSRSLAPFLFFFSGFVALVYQILWLKDLGHLFGNAAHATATTLTVFFLGLATGGYFWGRYAPKLSRPLRAYGWLEIGIGITGLFYFALLDLYRWLYAPLYMTLQDHFAGLLAAKFFLALLLLFPPAFLMGGTFPVIGQFQVRKADELGRVGTWLYGINTAGAALGALAAGFYLPRFLGFDGAYLLAVLVSLGIGMTAWLASGRTEAIVTSSSASSRKPKEKKKTALESARLGQNKLGLVETIAFASGFITLGLEVVWTRMFAQVLQNSVYTFSTILVVFLVALAGGAFLAHRLCQLSLSPYTLLTGLLIAAGLGTATTPFLFYYLTGGLGYVGVAGEGWGLYILSVFALGAAVLLLPALLLGTVFPYLLRIAEARKEAPGAVLGRLVAFNTTGTIAGSLITGFFLLSLIGLWQTLFICALAYLALANFTAFWVPTYRRIFLLVSASATALVVIGMNPTELPLVPTHAGERVLQTWEGHHGVVAVIEQSGNRRIKVNNYYTLGSSAAIEAERNQALFPLLVHPHPESVFFLGMGTGITAGAALLHPVREVVVAELIPEVITAAATHFSPYTNGLFDDPRVQVLPRDGRNHLAGMTTEYDLIIAELFIPWEAGTGGNLYTREHFETVKQRLRPEGSFVQWLPLYQLSRKEFDLIARTMLEVFPQVVVWRGDFFPQKSILALVGSVDAPPLDPAVLATSAKRGGFPSSVLEGVILPFYAGNLTEAADLIPPGPLNTDAKPRLEYEAPLTHRATRTGKATWFVGEELLAFYTALQGAVPPEQDPYLRQLSFAQHDHVREGLRHFRKVVKEDAQGQPKTGSRRKCLGQC